MTPSAAQIRANQENARRSTGPKTPEGKERSRANALKHGLTGDGVVLPNEDVVEVDRRFAAYAEDLKPVGEVARDLVRRAAICSVRMDRAVSQETASISDRIRQADADFVAPQSASAAEVAQLRAEASARAMFDPSKEASLARKYEAAAERCFFRSLRELRQLQKTAQAIDPATQVEVFRQELGSFLNDPLMDPALDALFANFGDEDLMAAVPKPGRTPLAGVPTPFSPSRGGPDVPFSIGRPRK